MTGWPHPTAMRLLTATATAVLLGLFLAGPAPAMFTGVEQTSKTTAATSATKTATVTCSAGKRVVGTGVDVSPSSGRVLIDYVRPTRRSPASR